MDSRVSAGQLARLEHLAAQMRMNIVCMMGTNKYHHFGGSLSATDIVTALYFYKMRYDPKNPRDPGRDRFLMSKGHSVPAQYAALAMAGFFPMDELPTLKQFGSRLQGHPVMQLTPGLEGCTGSLGQGLSFCNGIALAAGIRHLNYRVYCLIGDGELHEGQVWEAAMTSVRKGLGNLTAIVDANGLKGMDNACLCCKPLDGIGERWAGFGWQVRDIDGHDMRQICDALDWASSRNDCPTVIVARTVKGKGVSFMENQPAFHNGMLTEEQYAKAVGELKATLSSNPEALK